jgi:hypothetical protein
MSGAGSKSSAALIDVLSRTSQETSMRTHEEELAYKILMRDGQWGMTGCLEMAKAEIALRGQHVLDDLSQIHLRLLALMCSGLQCNDSNIEIHLNADLEAMASRLSDLADAGYIHWNGTEYEATGSGRSAARQIGIEMLLALQTSLILTPLILVRSMLEADQLLLG